MITIRVPAILAIVATSASIISCAVRGAPHNPVDVYPDSLFGNVQTIAVAPVEGDGNIEIPGDAAAELEAALEQGLLSAGFAVVPTFEYVGTWQHIANRYGGFFDEYTGELDDDAFEEATSQLRQELTTRFQVDAVLLPELWEGTVPFEGGVAQWDGVSQAVFGAYGLRGEVRALSLVVNIEDMAGAGIYTNGIGFATIEAWHRDKWLPLVLDAVIGDQRLISRAVSGVLAPIIDARTADSSHVR